MNPEELVKIGKITYEQYEDYRLFQESELGRKWLSRMMTKTFMETPQREFAKPSMFVFMDGRRSVLRSIKATIDHIFYLMEQEGNDNGKSESGSDQLV